MMSRLRAARVFDGYTFHEDAEVVINDGRIESLDGTGPAGEAVDLGDVTLAPGLVDVHCHGGAGASFSQDPLRALEMHRRAGSTTVMASLVTGALDDLEAQVRTLAPLVSEGMLAGIHLEGPWLAEKYKGAHPAERLRDPDLADVQCLVKAGDGAVRMVTLAPERAGALEATTWLAEQGIVVAVGHTDSTYEQTRAAIAAGACGATHLFNAMPSIHHRQPGPVIALLDSPQVWCEVIFDGTHVRPELLAFIMTQRDRIVFITDAMAAAGCADGTYTLGELPVTVTDGIARITGTDTIAGSTLVLSRAVENAIRAGIDPETTLRAATSRPAEYLDLAGAGVLKPGNPANLCVFNPDYTLQRVMLEGVWL